MSTVSLSLPESLVALLEKESQARETTASAVVQEALEKLLCEKEGQVSCYDLSKHVIGSVKGAPHDLATNPKNMEDYGAH
jgi:hypothetical protein